MKIFAKRGSKNKPSLVQKPSISDADASVLELLKKDPCELNSKERRMIKRYEDRKKNDDGEVEVATNEIEIDDAENLEKEPKSTEESSEEFKELTQPEGTKPESEKNINPEQDSDGINEQKARELLDKLNSKSKRNITRQLEREGSASLKSFHDEASRLIEELKEDDVENLDKEPKSTEESSEEFKKSTQLERTKPENEKNSNSGQDCGDVNEQKVRKLLDKLNSKSKRKITRQLEREGSASLKSFHDEASRLIEELKEDDVENLDKEPKSTEESSEEFKKSTQLERTKPENEKNSNSGQDCGDVNEQKVRKLLDKLNSKSKRKLTRQLEREGSASLKSIYDEASRLIQELKESSIIEDKEGDKSKKRKRSKSADWSSLPAEERLRREEQRRSQKEAAERRAREGDQPNKKYKHPLNSERRRANRRKPKWSITS
eukprot:CAMPEP_0194229992 /NCGR_PEP_ID=MMETSP0156-20130528/44179_1 /TAXON_ID=33649 /ORGANISM="Thalassionema nitzschioides, Strain L26-B" /LENGTH=433 /DNA_ID=CAMNT_0038962561 /DNA_START=38 /DNA_END=1336 /DNA_ORIENTATION=+